MTDPSPASAATPRHGALSRGAMVALVVGESLKSFGRNHGLERAATLSFYGFLAMVPLLMILFSIAGMLLAGSERVTAWLVEGTASVTPEQGRAILKEIGRLANGRGWTAVGLLVLLWSVTPLTRSIRNAFGAVFGADRPMRFWEAKLRDLATVLLLLVLLALLVAGQAAGSLLPPDWLARAPGGLRLAGVAIRLLIGVVGAVLFYLSFAPVRLQPGVLLCGAGLTTLLLGLIGPVFGVVLRFNPDYGYAFGSLKAVFILFMWVYYSFAAVLLVAEIMANIRRREVLVLKSLFADGARRALPDLLINRFTRAYEPGELLFKAGDAGDEMFYVLDGVVRLTRGDRLLSEMRAGDYFGEMAMLIASPRTADARAGATGAVVARVSAANFELVLRENPRIVQAILREMARRLKTTSDRLTAGD